MDSNPATEETSNCKHCIDNFLAIVLSAFNTLSLRSQSLPNQYSLRQAEHRLHCSSLPSRSDYTRWSGATVSTS